MPVVGDRIHITIPIWDLDGNLTTVAPVGAQIQISKNDGAFVNAAGVFGPALGDGVHLYVSTAAEALGAWHLALRVVVPGVRGNIAHSEGPDAAPALRIYIPMWDFDAQLVAGIAATVEVSKDGSLWAAAANALQEVGGGWYYYQPTIGETGSRIAIKVNAPTAQENIAEWYAPIGGGGGGDVTAPTISIISPTPDAVPGVPAVGGFPADYATAKNTPIVVRVVDVAPGLAFYEVAYLLPDGNREIVHQQGSFFGRYTSASMITPTSGGFDLSCRRDGGWPPGPSAVTFAVTAIDGDGNIS